MNQNDVRLREHVGIVTSDTSTRQFGFFVTSLKNRAWVGLEDYVMVDHPVFGESCPLLAVVKDIRNYEEVVGTTVNEKSVETVATSEIFGYVDLRDPEARPLRKLSVPPSPGSKVYLPSFEFLEDVLLRDIEGKPFMHPLHLGTLESQAVAKSGDVKQLTFSLNAEDLMAQHLLIAGVSGSGKTHAATVIVEELANKTRYPVVILDPHGEYLTVGLAGRHLKELKADDPTLIKNYPFSFRVSLYAYDSDRAVKNLKRLEVEYGKGGRFSVESVQGEWSKACSGKAEAEMKEALKKGVKPGQVAVIDANGLPECERGNFFTCFVKALWQARDQGGVEPFMLVVEDSAIVEKQTLNRIASEGRKAGVSLCLLVQHPTELSSAVLSQTSAQLIGRTMDARDLECLKNMAGDKCALLPQLARGEWIANGITMIRPTGVRVRERYSLAV
ncbi:MAG: ATP-binding protein [Candidatus Bathyarchaeia archaeon]